VDSRDEEAAISEIFSADIMATSVGVNVLKFIAKPVARAIERRIAANRPPLNILLCENLMEADKYFEEQLKIHLGKEASAEFSKHVGLVEASIGRMVPVLEREPGDNPLKVCVEQFETLHLCKDGFVGGLPEIKNTIIFSPFDYYIQRKLFVHNMCHAVAAYLGALKGYTYISEAVADAEIRYIVHMAGLSSCRAIAAETGQPLGGLMDFLEKLLHRFANRALMDTVERVGKDPLRKLGAADRLAGAYALCKKQGVATEYICAGIAAALLFDCPGDTASQTVSAEAKTLGASRALVNISKSAEFTPGALRLIDALYACLSAGGVSEAAALCSRERAKGIPDN